MPEYRYIKHNSLYYCLKQNPIALAWVIFFTKSSFDPISKPYSPEIKREFLTWLKKHYYVFRISLKKLAILLLYKYGLRRANSSLVLPFYGNICKPAHNGYKIFDFRRKRVIKIFDRSVDKQSIVKEIERLKTIAAINFAPSIRKWSIEEYWYEEDYIDGFPDVDYAYKPILDSSALKERFGQDIVPCIETIMLFQRPLKKELRIYTNEISKTLRGSRLYQQRLESDEIHKIRRFVDSIIEQLNVVPDCLVYLLFTHGDFCSANILNSQDNVKIIDWESATYRSALFDFYSYCFYRPYRGKISTEELALEINEIFPFLLSRLSVKAPDIADSLISLGKVYRWLYYVERISMLLEREKTDANLNIMERMVKYLDTFNRYEEICSSDVVQ